jgi:hypothetical protein
MARDAEERKVSSHRTDVRYSIPCQRSVYGDPMRSTYSEKKKLRYDPSMVHSQAQAPTVIVSHRATEMSYLLKGHIQYKSYPIH